MKHFVLPTLALLALAGPALAGNFGGPGPWANGSYYPGGTDGKYQASVIGDNMSGVISFAIQRGNQTTVQQTTANVSPGVGGTGIGAGTTIVQNTETTFNGLENYFVIFVEGRTYFGNTAAMIDPVRGSVSGALVGNQPAFNLITNTVTQTTATVTNTTNVTVIDPLPLINRGLSGGFNGKVKSNQESFLFYGDGQVSTPSEVQVLDLQLTTNSTGIVSYAGTIETQTRPFQLKGVRTSFVAGNTGVSVGDAGTGAATAE